MHLRKTCYLGQLRISWYLKMSMEQFKRYEKQVPGHRIQVDVKFLFFNDKSGKRVKRYQYTAIDDASRARALRIYRKRNQKCAIEFLDYVRTEFPFRIHTVQTDNRHEFQALFHWHCEDLGIRNVCVKKASPHLNGKAERSRLTDQQEFCQLPEYKGDIDIGKNSTLAFVNQSPCTHKLLWHSFPFIDEFN